MKMLTKKQKKNDKLARRDVMTTLGQAALVGGAVVAVVNGGWAVAVPGVVVAGGKAARALARRKF